MGYDSPGHDAIMNTELREISAAAAATATAKLSDRLTDGLQVHLLLASFHLLFPLRNVSLASPSLKTANCCSAGRRRKGWRFNFIPKATQNFTARGRILQYSANDFWWDFGCLFRKVIESPPRQRAAWMAQFSQQFDP